MTAEIKLKDIHALGKENLPASGGFMIIPTRLSYQDLLRVEALLNGRKVVYVMEDGAAVDKQLQDHLQQEHATVLVILPNETDTSAYRKVMRDTVDSGAVVIYLPALAAVQAASITTVPGSRLDFLLRAEVPVLPLFVHHPGEVAMAIEPEMTDRDTVLAFGPLLEDENRSLAAYQESLFVLAEKCFSANPALDLHLGYALLLGFKKHGSRTMLFDGKDDKELRFDKVFAAALALSRVIREETKKSRVGIILPPGAGGFIANMAVLLAGKTPVNFNFTAARPAVESAIRRSDIDRFLTADLFVRKMQLFPWPPLKQLIFLERLMPKLKTQITKWFIISKLLPAPLLASAIGLPRKGGHKEALLLFTSGSSGEPKGVVLTHRNVLANVAQFGSRLNLKHNDAVLGCLPLFHSFGCTVTLWYPVIQGVHLVTYPSPLETKKLAELIEKHRVTLVLSTPTFLRGYLRGVNREQLASVKMCVTGAEKLPASVAEAFETKFGKRVFEGYGLTETSPATNVNLPDPEPLGDQESHAWLPSYRFGSVGQMLPGLAVRITNPESGAAQSIHHSGMIWFKGANVFGGYLGDPKRSAEVLTEDGWFRTGDVGRVDLDGFLYIEGRLSRFSKIGGEMVPHETVEDALIKALGLENESQRRIAIVGVPDPDKGEALILLSTLPGGPEAQEIVELRHRLLERGMPTLWIPRKLIRVTEIPVLASGKLDVQGCEKLALGGAR